MVEYSPRQGLFQPPCKFFGFFTVWQSVVVSKTSANFALQAETFAIKNMSLRHYSGGTPYRSIGFFKPGVMPRLRRDHNRND
jgi:hypothetical protein